MGWACPNQTSHLKLKGYLKLEAPMGAVTTESDNCGVRAANSPGGHATCQAPNTRVERGDEEKEEPAPAQTWPHLGPRRAWPLSVSCRALLFRWPVGHGARLQVARKPLLTSVTAQAGGRKVRTHQGRVRWVISLPGAQKTLLPLCGPGCGKH